jgi:hypothetical protein
MFNPLNSTLLDHRDEIVVLLVALAIPLTAIPSMIF